MTSISQTVANYHNVLVPHSNFLNERRIERLNAGTYEGAEVRGALSVISAYDRVLELGAGIGVVGAAVAINCSPEAMISYEANKRLIPTIEALYQTNALAKQIELRNRVLLAGKDQPKSLTFYLKNSYLGSSLTDSDHRVTTPVEVSTDSWDDVVRDFKPTVLVMDIEGGELDLLRAADLTGIRAIILEFHPGVYGVKGMRQAKNILREQGFARHNDVSTREVWTCTRTV